MPEAPEASTPFASAVDLQADGSESSGGFDSDSDRSTFVSPWWRRLSAPSRPVMVGALVAAVAAGLGWTAGAKPWASHRSHSALAAKGGSKQTLVASRSTPAHGSPASAHANRRVAVNGKSKTTPAAAPARKAKPASAAKHLAAPAPGAAAKTSANKVGANKASAKAAPGKAKSSSLVGTGKAKAKAKAKAKTAPAKTAKPAAKAAKPKVPAAK